MSTGFTDIRVLPELEGKPWNDITRAYVSGLRPSVVRVIEEGPDGYLVKTDARLWRVDVYVTLAGNIDSIKQEVEVELPEGVRHGYDLDCRLEKL